MRDTSVLEGVLEDGTAVEIPITRPPPMTVWVNPATGDTVRVEYRAAATAPWRQWDHGDVTEYADDVTDGPVVALRFTRTAGAGTTSAYGVL